MSDRRSPRGVSKTRRVLAREAARLMYEEDVSEYFVAKRMAAKRLFGHGGQKRMRFRPRDLPSNGFVEYQHLRLDLDYPVELTVYDRMDLRHRPRSSTDGRPIERISIRMLTSMLS